LAPHKAKAQKTQDKQASLIQSRSAA